MSRILIVALIALAAACSTARADQPDAGTATFAPVVNMPKLDASLDYVYQNGGKRMLWFNEKEKVLHVTEEGRKAGWRCE